MGFGFNIKFNAQWELHSKYSMVLYVFSLFICVSSQRELTITQDQKQNQKQKQEDQYKKHILWLFHPFPQDINGLKIVR